MNAVPLGLVLTGHATFTRSMAMFRVLQAMALTMGSMAAGAVVDVAPVLATSSSAPSSASTLSADVLQTGTWQLIVAISTADGAATPKRAAAAVRDAGLVVSNVRPSFRSSTFVVKLPRRLRGEALQDAINEIAGQDGVLSVEPDQIRFRAAVPTDPYYSGYQWDLRAPGSGVYGINMPAAWDINRGASNVVVADIDTGFLPHDDLSGRFVQGYDFISEPMISNDGDGRDPDPRDPGDWVDLYDYYFGGFYGCDIGDSSWHGTHVSGTIAATANNDTGIAGINWVSSILPVRVLGKCGGLDSDIIDGMRWAAGLPVAGAPRNDHPARVINVSLGGSGSCPTNWQIAINEIVAAGAVVVAAAGNSSGSASGFAPGNCANVITVAATGRAGKRAFYSNYGGAVEIAAPGGDSRERPASSIFSTVDSSTRAPYNDSSYAGYLGTSMATAHVSGAAALLLSANPALTPGQVTSLLRANVTRFPTGSNCTTSTCGSGILNVAKALAATAPTGAPTPPTNLRARSRNQAVELQWDAPWSTGGSALTEYVVQYSTDRTNWSTVNTGDGSSTAYTVSSLTNAVQYWFRIAARNALGTSANTADLALAQPGHAVPGPPAHLEAVPLYRKAVLSWEVPDDDGGSPITDYVVEISSNGTSWTVVPDGTSSTTSVTVTNLDIDAYYYYRVAATNSVGTGPYTLLGGASTIDAGSNHTCASTSSGAAMCWGAGGAGQLGNGSLTNSNTPQLVNGAGPAVAAAAGGLTSCALVDDGTATCWGANGSGQAGSLSRTNVNGIPETIDAFDGVTDIDLGSDHGCAALGDGSGRCWGAGLAFQLGNGGTVWGSDPVPVSGLTGIAQVSAGNTSSCATKTDGSVWCWGNNDNGQLGDSSTDDRGTPVRVTGIDTARQVSVGSDSACAVLMSGAVRCWGDNAEGELGNGTTTPSTTPVAVMGITDATSISVGSNFACAVTSGSGLKCWGAASSGQLGRGPSPAAYYATPVSVVGIIQPVLVAAGGAHACAIDDEGRTWCWGYNSLGQNGSGDWTATHYSPAASTGLIAAVFTAGPPTAPLSLTATDIGTNSVSLDWDTPLEDGGRTIQDYHVEYATLTGSWTTLPHAESTATAATVSGLSTAVTYRFRVSAHNTLGMGARSEVITATPRRSPDAPTNLLATASWSTVTLTWGQPAVWAGADTTDWRIEQSLDGINWTEVPDAVSTEASLVIPGHTYATTYWYRVSARNIVGWGPPTTPVSIYIARKRPAPPTIAGTPGPSKAWIEWTAPDDGGYPITSYVMQMSRNKGRWTTVRIPTGPITGAWATRLVNGSSYRFRVAAKNRLGQGTWSSYVTVVPRTVPGTVRLLSAKGRDTHVVLKWLAPNSNGGAAITDYVITMSTDGIVWTPIDDGVSTLTTADIIGLTNGIPYRFQVAAVNVAGTGKYVTSATVAPRLALPGAPTITSALSELGQATVYWRTPSDDGGSEITDYVIAYSLDGLNWTVFPDAVSSARLATVSGLISGRYYRFRVAAVNKLGQGAYSRSFTKRVR